MYNLFINNIFIQTFISKEDAEDFAEDAYLLGPQNITVKIIFIP